MCDNKPRDHRIATPKAFQTAIPVTHTEIGGGYSYALLRVGAILRHPSGREVYFQPGDDATALVETIACFDEISTDIDNPNRELIVDMALGDYFA